MVARGDTLIAALICSLLVVMTAPDNPRYIQLVFTLALTCAAISFLFWQTSYQELSLTR